MKRLGHTRYVSQGGDWGALIAEVMGLRPAPDGLSAEEKAAFDSLTLFSAKRAGYRIIQGTRPQAISYALTDSPVGLAAWMYDYNGGEPQRLLTNDEMLDDITLYWLTGTAATAARIYWENNNASLTSPAAVKTREISIPAAVTVSPDEIFQAPRSWTEQAYPKLIYYHRVDKGGHFAAWEQPQLFSEEIRAAFRPLR
jgi:pimeloyl-ACP methyl ester carboxylesterase